MWTRTCFAIVAVSLLLNVASDRTYVLAWAEPKQPMTIRADEIGESVTVLGRLGSPLRSVVSVSGIWVELTEGPSKPGSSLRFHADEISGKRLDKPVEFRIHDVKVIEKDGKAVEPVKGEQWKLRAYETWPDYGHPSDFINELGHRPGAPAPRGPTRLIGILVKRTTSSQIK